MAFCRKSRIFCTFAINTIILCQSRLIYHNLAKTKLLRSQIAASNTDFNSMKTLVKHKKAKIILLALAGLFIAFLCIPIPHFNKPYSTVLTAKTANCSGRKSLTTANGVSPPPIIIP